MSSQESPGRDLAESGEAGSSERASEELKRHIRGSGLLLLGRVISVLLNFAAQVLTIRYLSKSDYGAFAWAVAVVSIASTLSLLSLHRGTSRFLPVYMETEDAPAQRGVILLALGSTLIVGLSIVALTFAAHGFLDRSMPVPGHSTALLLILIGLAPVQGLESVFESLFAVCGLPRAIFLRRHVLGPSLRIAAVLGVIATAGSVRALAFAYLTAGVLGFALYAVLLRRLLGRLKLLGKRATAGIKIPAATVYKYCLPLLSGDLLWFLKTTFVIILLERLSGTAAVAEYRSVASLAGLSALVLQNVWIFYMPLASRLFTRNDMRSLEELHSRTTAWIAVIAYPVFAACVFLAEPVTVSFFGKPYSSASTILILLASGYYCDAVLGISRATLSATGEVQYIAVVNAATAAFSIIMQVALIMAYGAFGAGIAAGSTLVVHVLILHRGLIRKCGIGRVDSALSRVFGSIAVATCILLAARILIANSFTLFCIVGLASLAVLYRCRYVLDISSTFPELQRVPGMKLFVGLRRRA